jgi:predicted HAD superfamily Cof-like phosphohydrolase
MSINPQDAVRDFHTAFDLTRSEVPGLPSTAIRDLRIKLLKEEWEEYLEGEATNDLTEIADALADMVYIAYGTAVAYGKPLDKVFDEVHRSNMSKLGPDGKPIYREDGKVMKPANWSPPNINAALFGAATTDK